MPSITYLLEKNISSSLAPQVLTGSSPIYGLEVYTGIDNGERSAPAIIASANNAREEFIDSAIWHIQTSVNVVGIAPDTTIAQMETWTDTVFNAVSNLTSSSDLTVLGKWITGESEQQREDVWIRTMNFEFVCTGA